MKAAEIIKAKGSGVSTILPHNTVREALKAMLENKVGSLVAIDEKHNPVGIITEKDIVKLVYKHSQGGWQNKAINEVMSKNIIIGFLEDDIEYIMALMTANRIRHVPIISGGRLSGLVSIGDIVKSQLRDIKAENRYLSDYITGKYPA